MKKCPILSDNNTIPHSFFIFSFEVQLFLHREQKRCMHHKQYHSKQLYCKPSVKGSLKILNFLWYNSVLLMYPKCSFSNNDMMGSYREDLNYKNCHNSAVLHNNNLKGVITFVFSLCLSGCELIVFTAPTIICSCHAVWESGRGRQSAQKIILKAHSHIRPWQRAHFKPAPRHRHEAAIRRSIAHYTYSTLSLWLACSCQ